MSSTLITEQSRFDELCQEIESAGEVAFDTEFVSEFTYRPELCLLQFATRQRAVAVDPYRVPDLSRWWQIMAGGKVSVTGSVSAAGLWDGSTASAIRWGAGRCRRLLLP